MVGRPPKSVSTNGMSRRAAITVNRPRADVERLWEDPRHRSGYLQEQQATVTFREAPGDRGTEIHVEVPDPRAGVVGEAVQKVTGNDPYANAKDELRRFKALVETGVVPRSDGSPEGELAERKLKQRPAQPLEESELQEVGVR